MEQRIAEINLSATERHFLDLVYEHFDRELNWPERGAIKRMLYQRGERKASLDALMARLAPALIREIESSGRRLRLTLLGFRSRYKMVELNDLICFLRLAIDKYGRPGADKKLSTAELVQRCGVDAHRMRKLDLLLEGEIYIAHSTARGPDGGPFEWEIDDEITRYHDVVGVDSYLEAREREIRALATADIPPVHLLAAEGVPLQEPSTTDRVPDEQPASLGELIEDGELRERCGDLLLAGGKFDRVILQAAVVLEDRVRAAIGGSDRVGVPLMQFAFSADSPKLRLSQTKPEQAGAMQIYAGVMAFFRNPTGHTITQVYTSEEALRFVAMVDLLLGLIARAQRSETANSAG